MKFSDKLQLIIKGKKKTPMKHLTLYGDNITNNLNGLQGRV